MFEDENVMTNIENEEEKVQPEMVVPEAEEAPKADETSEAEEAPKADETSEAEETPETTEAEAEAEAAPAFAEAEETPKKKGGKIGLILGIAAAIAAAAAAGLFFMLKSDPEKAVIAAFMSIADEAEADPANEIFGYDELMDMLKYDASESVIELSLKDASASELDAVNGFGISLKGVKDPENKCQSAEIGLITGSTALAKADMYIDTETIALQIPVLTDYCFEAKYADDFENQLANSPYVGKVVEKAGYTKELTAFAETLKKAMDMSGDREKIDALLPDYKGLMTRYILKSDAYPQLEGSMKAKKSGSENRVINGEDTKCTVYDVEISRDAAVKFLTTSKDFFLQDEEFKAQYAAYTELVNEASGMYSLTKGKSIDELYAEADENLTKGIQFIEDHISDVVYMKAAVRPDGKMAGFTISGEMSDEDGPVAFTSSTEFKGGYSIRANIYSDFVLTADDGNTLGFTFDKTDNYKANECWNQSYSLAVDTGDDHFAGTASVNYSVADGDFDADFTLGSKDTEIAALDVKGYTENIEKGKSVDFIMDDVDISYDQSGKKESVGISGAFKVGPKTTEVTKPEGKSFDVLAASEDDYNELIESIGLKLMMMLFSMFG